MRESLTNKRVRAAEILIKLQAYYGEQSCALDYWDDPFKLTIAVMLSAQTTDKAVNKVTPKLWERYPSAQDLAQARQSDVAEIISSIGLYRNKSAHAIGIAQIVVSDYGGVVPCDIDELQKLPGVGRKTANIVMGEGFGKPVGIAVDTHVNRIAHKLKLVGKKTTDPNKVEEVLLKVFAKESWGVVNHTFVLFGREFCDAKRPKCNICPISDLCPSNL